MKIEKFKSLIEEKIEEIETIIDDNMVQVGNKASDCQKIYLQQQLNKFSYALNGVIKIDLKVITLSDIDIVRTKMKDIDSTNLKIFLKSDLIGYGTYNIRTNFAHVSLFVEDQELEDFIMDAIENHKIEL